MSTETINVVSHSANPQPAAEKAAPAKEVEAPAVGAEKAADEKDPAASGAADEPVDKEENEEGDEDDVEGEQPKKKSKGGFQKRVSKLIRQKAEIERERDFLRGQVEALKGGKPPAGETPPADKSAPVTASGEPKEEDYGTHKEYVIALADWRYDQRKAKDAEDSAKAEKQTAEQKTEASFVERREAFKKAHPDYNDVMEACEAPLSKFVQKLLVESENGPELSYHLAKKPELLERMSKMSDAAAAREFGKFEASLSSQAKDAPKAKTTNAPAPINPVGGGSRSTSTKTIYDAAELTQAEYEKLRDQQERAKRGA